MLLIKTLDHLVLNVNDVEASAQWYSSVLGMVREDFRPSPSAPLRTSMKFGSMKFNLRPVHISADEWSTGERPTAGSDDLCFLTDSSLEEVSAHLKMCKVPIIIGPAVKRGAKGNFVSVYCRDPDGNLIEISSYDWKTE